MRVFSSGISGKALTLTLSRRYWEKGTGAVGESNAIALGGAHIPVSPT